MTIPLVLGTLGGRLLVEICGFGVVLAAVTKARVALADAIVSFK